MRALIVDDNEEMRALARLNLELAGVEVVGFAGDAVAGISRWLDERPDVVVLDHRMPGHNGLDAAESILGKDPTARVLLFSAYLDDATVARAASLGVTCVPKGEVGTLVELAVGRVAA